MWFELKGDARLGRCCTEGCGGSLLCAWKPTVSALTIVPHALKRLRPQSPLVIATHTGKSSEIDERNCTVTYEERFPIGCRVVVVAPPGEGSDCEFNGCTGSVVEHGMWFRVRLDKPPKYWRNPVTVCQHNLQKETR